MLATSATLENPRSKLLSVAAVLTSTFFVGVAFGLGYPLASFRLTDAGAADWLSGLTGAAPSLGMLLMLPFLPKFVRQFGAVTTMAVGGLAAAASYAMLVFFDGPLAWLVLRFLAGLAIALPWLVSQTWIVVASNEATRGRVLALYVMAFSGGMAICPPLLKYAGLIGPPGPLIGSLVSLLSIVPILLVRTLAPEADHKTMGTSAVLRALAWTPIAMTAAFLCGFIELVQLSLLPNAGLAMGIEKEAVLHLLTLFMFGALTLQFAIGWLADRIAPKRLAIAVSGAIALMCIVIPVTLDNPDFGGLSIFVLGGLTYGIYTVGLAVLGELKGGYDTGAGNAAFIMCYQAGGIAGPVIAGVAMSFEAVSGFTGIQFAAGTLSALAMAWWLMRSR